MNIKEILADILPKADISDEKRKALSDWIEQFEKVPDEQELLNTVEQLRAERDSARKSLDDMIYKEHVAKLAETYSFSDNDYLEYLCKLNKIDFADNSSSKKFMDQLQVDAPKFFKLNLQAGTGAAAAENVPHHHHEDHYSDILNLLNNAPEIMG